MDKTQKTDNRYEPRRPAGYLYHTLVPLAKLLSRILIKARFVRDPEIKKRKGPFVVVGTHSCYMDVAMMMLAMYPVRLNIVCGRDVFTWKKIKPIKDAAGLIPINQFEIDLGSIRMMKRAVDNGLSLALFPEGKFTLDGKNMFYLPESLAKLLKLIGADVVFMHNYGGYCSKPRWYSGFKYGPVTNKSELLFTKEELKAKPVDEIYRVLEEKFSFNDPLYQQENKLRFKSKHPALGIHYILYKCPKCGTEYEMVSTDHHIICEKCHNKVAFDEYGTFTPENGSVTFPRIDLWYDFERESARRELMKEDFSLSYPVVWAQNDDENNYNDIGEGEFFMTREKMGFRGKKYSGEEASVEIPLFNQYTIVHKNYEAIDLTVDNRINRFYFKDVKYSCKINVLVEENFRLNHGLPCPAPVVLPEGSLIKREDAEETSSEPPEEISASANEAGESSETPAE